MFKSEQVIEFITKIIERTNKDNIESSKESLKKIQEYLKLTTMCDKNIIDRIPKVVNCFEELSTIYQKTGICDLSSFFNSEDEDVEHDEIGATDEEPYVFTKKRDTRFDQPYQEKHYDRYVLLDDGYDSGCNSGTSYGSSC